MVGIPCDGRAYIFGEKNLVLCNTSIPDSTMKKNYQSIAHCLICEGAAADKWRMLYFNMHDIELCLLTKCLPNGDKRRGFVKNILYNIFGYQGCAS